MSTLKRLSHLRAGSLIIVLIGVFPIIFYSYLKFPESTSWETFLFTFNSGYYNDVFTSAWIFMGKFCPLYVISIWYITCKHWWKEVILIPIGTYLIQIFIYFNDEIKFKDEIDGWLVTPVVLGVLVGMFFLRRALKKSLRMIEIKRIIEEELTPIQ